MKKTMKKILALVLTMLMLLSVAAPVFANTAATVECPAEHTKESLDALGIKYTEISKHTAEFCEDRSYTTYRCDSCKTYFLDDIVLPAAGVKCEWEVTTVATCAVEGVKTCKVCKYEMKTGKDTSPNAHEWEYEVACGDAAQKTNRTCKICGIVEKDVFVKDTHTWNKIEVIEEPTCGVAGKAVYTCTNCNVTKTLEITADAYNAEHNWVYGKAQAANCAEKKDEVIPGYYCKDCGISAEMNQELVIGDKKVTNTSVYKVTPYAHDYTYQVLNVLSCTQDGTTLIKCKNCSYYELEKKEALGHHWERPGNAALDYSKLTKTLVLCEAATDTVGKYVYTEFCTDCGTDIVIYEEAHTIIKDKYVAPTCSKLGYVCDYCEICKVEFNVKVDDQTPVDPANHSWTMPGDAELVTHPNWYVVTKQPTCLTPGVATSVCKLCGAAENKNVVVPATHHDYYTIDPVTGQIVTDAEGKAVLKNAYLDCSIGAIVYTCTVCAAKPEAEREANWKFFEEIEGFDYNDPAWHIACGGNVTVVVGDARNHAGDCENDKVTVYECDKHNLYIVHNEGKQHNIDPLTYEPKLDPTCDADGFVGYERCLDCDYKSGKHSSKGGLIEKLGHDWDMTTYVEAFEPTCTTEGSKGYGVCLRENCKMVIGEKSEADRVIPALGHHMIETVIFADPTCTTYAYTHSGCIRCDLEYWVDYLAATGHDLDYNNVDDKPTCTEKGTLTCQNPDCGLGYTYTEEVNKIPHVDMEGQEIKCVTEDFYCFECCNPIFDATTGKFTGKYGTDPIAAIESHYYADTVLRGAADCTGYTYYLHVCTECDTTWVDPNEPMIPNDHNRVPGKVLTEATYLTPGVREVNCTKCNTVVGTEEYTLGVQFSFEFDNALVPGAAIVNSGYLAVKVYTNAYKQMVHSVDFTIYVDSSLFTLEEVVVEDQNSPFCGMFFAGQTGNFVNVYGTVANDANGKTQNIELNGADQYLATLIFKVADDANSAFTTIETVTAFGGYDGDSVVNALDGSVINSAFAGYDVPYANATVLGPVDNNKTPNDATDDKPFMLTIKILGDVNGDATKTNGAVASAVDVNKIRDLIAKGEYLAEADMDKDGAVTVADFEYLAVYHVGGMTYDELCMLPEVPQAPVVTPSCPCCP